MSAKNRLYGMLAGLMMLSCVMLGFASAASAEFIDQWTSGAYYEQGTDSRRGLFLKYIATGPEAGLLFSAFYTFDETTGKPFWVTGTGAVKAGDFSVDMDLILVEGGSFGAVIGNPVNTDSQWGTATVTVNSCSDITWSWASANVVDGSLNESSIQELVNGVPNSQCVYQKAFTSCPSFATAGADERTCVITGGEYTQDLHLTNDTLWVLNGAVFVGEKENANNTNAVYIEPGTRIIGVGESILGISRGARIFAEGTPTAPIVFSGVNTASDPVNPGRAGDWGGLTINGKAPINTCTTIGACTAEGEGQSGPYGGNNPNDSSGVMRYMRVQFAGILFTDENELNGIAFQGVGRGTVVENIQIHANADDGVEFFGGTVNVRNLVLTDIEDDSVDWTQGYEGRLQNILVVQSDNLEIGADRGIEADNLEGNNDAENRAKPWISNATFIGRADTTGATFRRGTGINITNSIFTNFGKCIDLDDSSTFTNAGTPANLSGNTTMENTILDCSSNFVEESGDPWTVQAWFQAQSGNSQTSANLEGVFPPAGAPYLNGYPVDMSKFDSFFQNYDHIGAFSSAKSAWTHGWTLQDF